MSEREKEKKNKTAASPDDREGMEQVERDEATGTDRGVGPEEHRKKKSKEELIHEQEKAIAEREKEIGELKDRLLYQQAEFENFKKLKAKEKQEALRFGNETMVKEILPVIDNLERAIDHASKTGEAKAIVEGVELTLSGLLKVLERFGVQRVEAQGKKFDPNLHEAVYEEERKDVAPGTVVGELQRGYIMDGRLLRPAMVSVAKKPQTE
ncbi:MAG TPA: nucleotide exchange factor GrpE [Deltaproteobacteria bacterium]|nr:nucleotide exchange factor GrpE [Deltaproteobacteria bacterium]